MCPAVQVQSRIDGKDRAAYCAPDPGQRAGRGPIRGAPTNPWRHFGKSNSMTLTVDLVIVGMTATAAATAAEAARRGKRAPFVGQSKNACYCRGLRRTLDAAGDGCRECVSILAGFEVVSVDGISTVEVVLIRQVKTGWLIGINAGAILVTIALASGVVAPTLRGEVEQNPSE